MRKLIASAAVALLLAVIVLVRHDVGEAQEITCKRCTRTPLGCMIDDGYGTAAWCQSYWHPWDGWVCNMFGNCDAEGF
jgi:hypothetical protein